MWACSCFILVYCTFASLKDNILHFLLWYSQIFIIFTNIPNMSWPAWIEKGIFWKIQYWNQKLFIYADNQICLNISWYLYYGCLQSNFGNGGHWIREFGWATLTTDYEIDGLLWTFLSFSLFQLYFTNLVQWTCSF